MKRIHAFLLVVVLLPASPARAQGVADPLRRAAWLTGCWLGGSSGRVVEERWMAPRGRTMVGVGRTIRGDSTTSVELTVLRASGDTLRYEAHPAGQPTAVFTAVSTAPGELAFENPRHDFPQRIAYRALGADSVLARIEGPLNGTWRGIDFPMARIRCEP